MKCADIYILAIVSDLWGIESERFLSKACYICYVCVRVCLCVWVCMFVYYVTICVSCAQV